MGQRAAKAANPYIISPRVDFLLIVGAVILCPALLLPAAAWTSRYTVRLVVMTFGAVGRHFPSFLRTYGDREIFQTYRTRLIVAPILLFAVTLGFSLNGLHGMLLIAFCWTIWHGMMQHFGFMRIYDAKIRSMDKTTARLDWWISFSWFGLCLSLSPHQCGSLPAKGHIHRSRPRARPGQPGSTPANAIGIRHPSVLFAIAPGGATP